MENKNDCEGITFTDAIRTPFLIKDGYHFAAVPLSIISFYNLFTIVVLILTIILFVRNDLIIPAIFTFFISSVGIVFSAYVQAYLIQGQKHKQTLCKKDKPVFNIIN